MVRSRFLTPNAPDPRHGTGDFYASTGVVLDRIEHANDRFTVAVQPKPGDTYTIQFIGTRRDYDRRREPKRDADGNPLTVTMDYSADIGRVLKEVRRPGHLRVRGRRTLCPRPDPLLAVEGKPVCRRASANRPGRSRSFRRFVPARMPRRP
jgi:hypothetical protein